MNSGVMGCRQECDAAWNAANLDSLVAPFTADAVIVDPFGGVTSGREAVEASFVSLFQGRAKGTTHKSRVFRIFFVTDEVALVDGEATIEGAGHEKVVHQYTDVLVRRGGTWRIAQVRAYTFMEEPSS